MTLRWTSAKPTVLGWYWFCYGDGTKPEVMCMDELAIKFYAINGGNPKWRWAGPLPIPQPEEEA